MKKNKKASVGMHELYVLIMVLLVFIIVFTAVVRFTNKTTKDFDRDVCRNSVFLQSATTVNLNLKLTSSSTTFLNIDCPKYLITFGKDSVMQTYFKDDKKKERPYEITLPGREPFTDFSDANMQLNNNIVNRVIAEELRWCWWQFLEGEMVLFRDNKGLAEWDFNNNNEMCFVCDDILFSKDIPQQTFTGFYDYITENHIPGSTMTYYEYISNPPICHAYQNELDGTNCFEKYIEKHSGIEEDIQFNTDESYKIVFIRMGEKRGTDKDDPAVTYFAYILPASQIAQQCDRMAS